METAKSIPISPPVHFPRFDNSSVDKEFLRSATLGNLLRQARISKISEDKEWNAIYPYPHSTRCTPGPPLLCREGIYSSHRTPAPPSLREEGTYSKIDK